MNRVSHEAPVATLPEASDGLFSRMEDAIAAAAAAQKQWLEVPMKRRGEIIDAIRKTVINNARDLANMAVTETGMGRVEHKVRKNILVAEKTPGIEDIPHTMYSGDNGMTVEEYTHFGVVGSITPSTNPSETVLSNAICALAAGNSIVYNFHPGAKGVSGRVLSLLNRAIVDHGGPRNMLAAVVNPTLDAAKVLFASPVIRLLVVTGGGGVVKAAMAAGKRCLAAGPGNPPVVVDDTADIDRAGAKITDGASLDNNVVCIAEKEIFVVDSVADALKSALKKHGGHELRNFELDRLLKTCLDGYDGPNGPNHLRPRRDSVGRDAALLAARIDITVPKATKILFCDVGSNVKHPLVQSEQLMPIIPVVRVPDFDAAMAAALDAEHGYSHTAMIHSQNLERITRFSRAINCSIVVVNGNCYNGLGLEGEGPTAWSITTPTGEGCTTPRNFARKRRMAIVDSLRIY